MKYDYYAILDFGLGNGVFTGFKNKTNNNNYRYVPLTDNALANDRNVLNHMTARSKIILLAHGSEGNPAVSSDDGRRHINAKQLAEYLGRNLNKAGIKPEVVFDGLGPKAAKANVSDAIFFDGSQSLTRRLTIQASVCEAADRGKNSVSFLENLFHELANVQVDANVVGYCTTVVETRARRLEYGFMSQKVISILPKGKGEMETKTPLERRRQYKTIFNADNRFGKQYDKEWKEIFKMDVLEQLRVEVNKDVWNDKGKGLFADKVPEGVRLLRMLFTGYQNLEVAEYDPAVHGNLAKDAYRIISERLSKNFFFTSRNDETTRLYQRFKNALEACI